MRVSGKKNKNALKDDTKHDSCTIEKMIKDIIKYKRAIGMVETEERLIKAGLFEIVSQYEHYKNLFTIRYM